MHPLTLPVQVHSRWRRYFVFLRACTNLQVPCATAPDVCRYLTYCTVVVVWTLHVVPSVSSAANCRRDAWWLQLDSKPILRKQYLRMKSVKQRRNVCTQASASALFYTNTRCAECMSLDTTYGDCMPSKLQPAQEVIRLFRFSLQLQVLKARSVSSPHRTKFLLP